MSDFNLLGFLSISVPNEPLTPITPRKENFKILTPSSKPAADDHASSPTPKAKKTPERLLERTTSSDNTSPKGKQSPYFRTTYGAAYGAGSSKGANPAEEAPSTPTSVSSVSSTISVCDDPECDDCLTKKESEAKKALAAHEREMDRTAFENANRRIEEEIASERRKEAEKRNKEKRELEEDQERLRAERAQRKAEKQKEDEDDAAMQRELIKVDHGAIEAANARNREYRGDLQVQMSEDRARRNAQEELERNQPQSKLDFGEDQDAREAAREAAKVDVLRALDQQIADHRSAGKAEQAQQLQELRRLREQDEAAYQAKKAAQEEKERKAKEEVNISNDAAKIEKRARAEEAEAEDREFTLAQEAKAVAKAEEEKRKADEKKRAELEALHRQLADQVQRRREALRQAHEEDNKTYGPKETLVKKKTLVHCVDCEQDLPAERFSNFVVTPNGKVYRKSKAVPVSSPLHKYIGKQPSAPYDFSHNYS